MSQLVLYALLSVSPVLQRFLRVEWAWLLRGFSQAMYVCPWRGLRREKKYILNAVFVVTRRLLTKK
jgi:hypothetical protein